MHRGGRMGSWHMQLPPGVPPCAQIRECAVAALPRLLRGLLLSRALERRCGDCLLTSDLEQRDAGAGGVRSNRHFLRPGRGDRPRHQVVSGSQEAEVTASAAVTLTPVIRRQCPGRQPWLRVYVAWPHLIRTQMPAIHREWHGRHRESS